MKTDKKYTQIGETTGNIPKDISPEMCLKSQDIHYLLKIIVIINLYLKALKN